MVRLALALVLAATAGCVADAETLATRTQDVTGSPIAMTRERIDGDLYHYELVVPVGDAPNAALRLHRVVREVAPWHPRRTAGGVMLLHGDFSTFITNFAPVLGDPASPVRGLAPYLARDLDVWGLDRRWALPAAAGDVSDLGAIGVAQELDDLRAALAIARSLRAATGQGGDRLALAGFSHGGQLAYAYAAVEGGRPLAQRHVDAVVPIDFYGDFAPDDPMRAASCELSAIEYQLVADGVTDSPNGFLIDVGRLARTAPDAPSPLFGGATNRGALLIVIGRTYQFAPFAPFYHLGAPILDGDTAIGLRETPEPAAAAWLEGATPHQSMREAADLDALLCGDGPQPVPAALAQIRAPVFYLGAAGGIGSLGLHATTSVSSTDVTTLIVQRFGDDRRAEDFGHADLLYATDAPALAWQPLAAWLAHH